MGMHFVEACPFCSLTYIEPKIGKLIKSRDRPRVKLGKMEDSVDSEYITDNQVNNHGKGEILWSCLWSQLLAMF